MKLKTLSGIFISAMLIASSITNAFACTALVYLDAKGRAYTGRTLEFVGMLPNHIAYYPAGTHMESFTPGAKKGVAFDTKYAIFAVTASGVMGTTKRDILHEAVNNQGLAFSTNSLGGNISPDVSKVPDGKILSSTDLGTWALGNFQTVAQVKKAIENKEVEIWLPSMPMLGTEPAPVHFGLWDRSGAGIVIEWTTGQTTVYDNPVGVMTNNPAFPWHLENMKNYAYLTNIDKNRGQFNNLKVASFDSGGNMANLPGNEQSSGRFVKAAYYSQFAYKGKTPEESILTLSHVMNNFDRPMNISADLVTDLPGGERSMVSGSTKSSSEVTLWTAIRDLSQNHFYLRTINSLNYSKFDINKLSALKQTKVIPIEVLNANTNLDATDLMLK